MSSRLRKKQSLPDLSVKVCFLCSTSAQYMTKYSIWKDSEEVFVEMHCAEAIPPDSMICKKDKLEAGRHYNTPGYIPKWKRFHELLIQNITVCAYHMFHIKKQ